MDECLRENEDCLMKNRFKEFHLSHNSNIVSDRLPGIESQKLIAAQKQYEGDIVSYPRRMPIALKRAKGAIVEDVDGNMLIDFFSGAGVLNVGHCNPEVLEYVAEQQKNLIHALDFPTENKRTLIANILDHLPAQLREDYKVSFCGPSGSDAVEAAIKLAKLKTGRTSIVAFQGSYHGMTSGALALTSANSFKENLRNLMPDVHFIPYSYCYRCPFHKNQATCNHDCADYFHDVLRNPHSGIPRPAAVILEPIQGEGGNIAPDPRFLERIVKIARAYDVVTIFDEVQSGFFRTGEFLASAHSTAVPDIYLLSKGLGGVGFPISAIVYHRDIESWGPGKHIGTFRGNQVSIAAGNAAFNFAKKYSLSEHVDYISKYLIDKLNQIARESSYIGDVRGTGLMIGVEFVRDRLTKTPFPDMVKQVAERSFQKGLLFEVGGHYNNVIRIVPPLIINEEIVDNAMEILASSVRASELAYREEEQLLVN